MHYTAIKKKCFEDFYRIGALLVPLRLFMGLGWLRASVEKMLDPTWASGKGLAHFFDQHEAFIPVYQVLVDSVFIPHAALFANVVTVGQALVGIALLLGAFTNIALLGGIFMNVNFMLIGQILPSAFYIVIQIELFVMSTGALLGVDTYLSEKIPLSFLVARPVKTMKNLLIEKLGHLILMLVSAGLAVSCLLRLQPLTPHAVSDPALVTLVISTYLVFAFWLGYHRLPPTRSKRKTFHAVGRVNIEGREHAIMTNDISPSGISIFCRSDLAEAAKRAPRLTLTFHHPLFDTMVSLPFQFAHAMPYMNRDGVVIYRLAGVFEAGQDISTWVSPLTGEAPEQILARVLLADDEAVLAQPNEEIFSFDEQREAAIPTLEEDEQEASSRRGETRLAAAQSTQ